MFDDVLPEEEPAGNLIPLVEGVPEAESRARKARNVQLAGFTALFAGYVGLGAGLIYVNERRDEDPGYETPLALDVALPVAVPVAILGFAMMMSSHTYRFDAINAYNDTILDASESP